MDIINIIKALKESQVFKYRPKRAVISIVGPDARDFLQRMSTNDMTKLCLNNSVETCFLNNKGRIYDYVTVMQEEAEAYALVSSFAEANYLLDWLEQFHFVEDFNLSISKHICEWIIKDFDFVMSLNTNNYPEIDESAWEILRIEAFRPEKNEVALGLMPQNIGLQALIAENKGCYLGQEVIAKALTYQKHSKSLAKAKLSLDVFRQIKIGDRVKDQKGHAGIITSLAPLYVPEYAQALAIVDDKSQSEDLPCEFIFAKN